MTSRHQAFPMAVKAEAEAGAQRFRFEPARRTPSFNHWHSRLVLVLKFLLPALALALIGLVALWPELQDEPPPPSVAPVQGESGTVQMLSPRYFGTDEKNRPFSVVAKSANQSTDGRHIVELEQPEAEITLEEGTWLALMADSGRFDRDRNALLLRGNVDLFRDDGFEVRTHEAHIDLNRQAAWGDYPVAVQGPSAEIAAQGFRISDGGATLVFTGKSRLLIRGVR